MKDKIEPKSGGRKSSFFIFHPSSLIRSALLFTIMAIFTGFLMTGCGPDPFFVPVIGINGVPETGTAGIPLVLTGTVNPGFASNSDIVWSVQQAGNTGAVLSGNTLNTQSGGTVLIRAIVFNGKAEGRDYVQDFVIAIIVEQEGKTQTPIAEDYAIGNLYQAAGTVIPVTISGGKSPGAVSNIRYDGGLTVPQEAGTYTVTFDVEAAPGWNAAYGLSAGTLTVIVTLPGFPNPITNTDQWDTAITMIKEAQIDNYILNIQGNVGVAGDTAATFGTTAASGNLTVTIIGNGKLYLTSTGNMLRIDARQRLVIDSDKLTLQGFGDNDQSVVFIGDYGTVELKNGTITGNFGPHNGGGVYMDNGTFTMTGGEISGNNATSEAGGGVHISGGKFTMNGGSIKNNHADNDSGGGVHVSANGDFTMSGGNIYGADDPSRENTAQLGAAVFVQGGGTARYGGSYGNGTITTTDNTLPPLATVYNIANKNDWNDAIDAINNDSNGAYTLNIADDGSDPYGIGIAGASAFANTFGTTPGDTLTVTLRGTGTLYLNSQGNMFRIGANQRLVIDSAGLTLEGLTSGENGMTQDNDTFLIYIDPGGTLELTDGTITGNITYDTSVPMGQNGSGGGVYVAVGGTFTMSGGKISGNTTLDGGGVYVVGGTFTMSGGEISDNGAVTGKGGGVYVTGNNSSFTMNGGKISGNRAGYGGGVYIEGGTFRIVTGTIYGSEATVLPAILQNTVQDNGAALYKLGTAGVAQYGDGSTWNSLSLTTSGSNSFTDTTIRYVNGVPVP
jgi:hypothetical protein